MKTFLQNLLIFFSLALCGLIAFQWVRETDLRKGIQARTDEIHDKMENIQNLQASVKRDETEITRLDGLRLSLTGTVKSNNEQIVSLNKSLDRSTNELSRAQQQIDAYKDALDRANESIKKQNDDIKKQNEEMAKISEDRNEVVKKFNKMAADYNDLAAKWNKQQEELAKVATNTPAAKK
jgi:chromosome segregation ATPase